LIEFIKKIQSYCFTLCEGFDVVICQIDIRKALLPTQKHDPTTKKQTENE